MRCCVYDYLLDESPSLGTALESILRRIRARDISVDHRPLSDFDGTFPRYDRAIIHMSCDAPVPEIDCGKKLMVVNGSPDRTPYQELFDRHPDLEYAGLADIESICEFLSRGE